MWPNPRSFQPAVTLSQLELICHHFHQLGNTSFSKLITRIGFWDSRILPSPLFEQLNHNFACCWHCPLFHGWGLGSRPWQFFFMGPWVPSLADWHVFHQTYCSPLGCFIVASGEPSAHPLAGSFSVCLAPVAGGDRVSVSCSQHVLLIASLRVSLHATQLSLVVRWLRRQPSRSPPSPVLDASFFSFVPIRGFGSSIDSPALACSFSLDHDFLVVIVHVVSLSRCFVRDFSSGLFVQLHLVVVYSDVTCR